MGTDIVMRENGWVITENNTWVDLTLSSGQRVRLELEFVEVTSHSDPERKYLPPQIQMSAEQAIGSDKDDLMWVPFGAISLDELDGLTGLFAHAAKKWETPPEPPKELREGES